MGRRQEVRSGLKDDIGAQTGYTCRCRKEQARHRLKRPSSPDAVPHNVHGHMCRMIVPQNRPSCRSLIGVTLAADGYSRPFLFVRALPGAGLDLQLLRSWPDVLRWQVRAASPCGVDARSRHALPGEPDWPLQPRRAIPPLSRPFAERDASGFPAIAAECSTGGELGGIGKALPWCMPGRAIGSLLLFLRVGPAGICSDRPASPSSSPHRVQT